MLSLDVMRSGGSFDALHAAQKMGPAPALSMAVLDQQGLQVTFQQLNYHVASNTGKKGDRAYLLKSVSGFFKPGEMSALVSWLPRPT